MSCLWGLILLLLASSGLYAQPVPRLEPRLRASWESSDWLVLGTAAAATTGSFLAEETVRAVFQESRSGVADLLERMGWWYGSPLFTVPASLVTLGVGELFDSDDVRDTGLLMSELLLTALFVQQPLRIVVGRARPLTGAGHLSFRPFTFDNGYASFISGHSWSAVGISNIVARQIDQPWAWVSLYALATITVLSRLYSDAHWLTDVVVGGVLGYAISTALWNHRQDETATPEAARRAAPRRWLAISLRI